MHLNWVSVVPLVAFCFGSISSEEQTSPEEDDYGGEPLEDWQMTYLEKIHALAHEAGLPEQDRANITKFDKDVCYTLDCLESAVEIMEATNFTVDPCSRNMWLNYVCKRRVDGVDNINQVQRQWEKVDEQTRQILEEMDLEDEFLLKEAQVYFHQCSKRGLHNKRDLKDILHYLKENYGEFPLISNRNPGPKFNWLNMVADMNRISPPGFIPLLLQVKYNVKSSKIKLDYGKFYIPTSSDLATAFAKKLQSTGGLKKPIRTEQFGAISRFLWGTRPPIYLYENIKADHKSLSINEFQNFTDETFKNRSIEFTMNWLEFFQRVFEGTDVEIDGEKTIVEMEAKAIMKVLSAVNNTIDLKSGSVVANALNLHFLYTLLLESTTLLDDMNDFRCNTDIGRSGEQDEICLKRVKEIFGFSLGKTYLNLFYDYNNSSPAILDLMENMKQGYIDVINDLDWMENSTKKFVEKKIEKIETLVVQPPWMEDRSNLEEYYSGYNSSIDKNSTYFENYLVVEAWKKMKKLNLELKKTNVTIPYDDMGWNRWLGSVQASYSFEKNEVIVEGGMVDSKSPLFRVNRPGFMNYGGLGMILTHEIGHSLDTRGRQFNEKGEKGEYWDEKSIQKYKEWTDRIVEDYTSYGHQFSETSAETIDSTRTLNENIADELGLFIGFQSYKKYLDGLEKKGEKEKILPGLKNVAPQKLLFMKFSNMCCDNKDIQDHFNSIFFGVHSTGSVRATMPIKRSRKFAETFGCEMPRAQV